MPNDLNRRTPSLLLLLLPVACSGPVETDPVPPDPCADPANCEMPVLEQFCAEPEPSSFVPPSMNGVTLSLDEGLALADALAERIRVSGEAERTTAALEAPKCHSAGAEAYATALRAAGDIARCRAYAEQCTTDGQRAAGVAYVGALCAWVDDDFPAARSFFEIATESAHEDCGDYKGRVFAYASFATGSYPDEVDQIVGRAWSDADADAAAAAVWVFAKRGSLRDEPDAEAFVAAGLAGDDARFRIGLLANYIYTLSGSQRVELLRDNIGMIELGIPSFFWIYATLYGQFGSDDAGRAVARRTYDAYVPFATIDSWFPVERNTYDYPQLYDGVCADVLLQGQAKDSYRALVDDWRQGAHTPVEMLIRLNALSPDRESADVLTAIGSMHHVEGRLDQARAAFWRAHELCPYYNRAHWGLQTTALDVRYAAFDDYETRLAQRRAGAELEYSESLSSYIVNYDTLTPETLAGVKFAIAFWRPYIDDFVAAGQHAYIKETFERLTQVPSLTLAETERVQRAGDFRLQDDIRGIGADGLSVFDRAQVMQAAFGAYNLAPHEMSHNFHRRIAPSGIRRCITRLFRNAQDTGAFVDAYSMTNEDEYFAQGITRYIVAPDAPARFGPNRQDLENASPLLYALVDQIGRADGPLEDIQCPRP